MSGAKIATSALSHPACQIGATYSRIGGDAALSNIYQLGPDEHPPLSALHRTNVPVPATRFSASVADVIGSTPASG